ncbi:TOMM precursor leader peptide-binding protein [Oceanobacillus sp. M65]|uniref:TOMM precursor leader peptide-binding protein n=1 Tax=Oceanobacillus sp. M65 TaxID=3457435 RepID=UPI000D138D79|nr:hypothetical protein OBCHQ24_04755 [Oceanobacillus iheyensis]
MKPIHIITVGSFGKEVAERISQRDEKVVVTELEGYQYFLPTDRFPSAKIHIFASDKPLSRLSKHLDIIFSKWKEPWLPIIQEHPYVRIGPFVIPDEEGCYHCFESRYLQHSSNPSHVKALYDYYSSNPMSAPKGYLPGFAGFVASYAWNLIQKFDQKDFSMAGKVYQLNMLSRTSLSSKVISVHGCPRCGFERDPKMASIDLLAKSIKPVLDSRTQKVEVNSK